MASVRRARRGASPPHDLRGDRRRGVAVDVRVDAVGRPARRRAQPARHRLGREPRDLEHPLPAARAAGSGCGRAARGRRSEAHGDGSARRSASGAAAGHRCGARARDRAAPCGERSHRPCVRRRARDWRGRCDRGGRLVGAGAHRRCHRRGGRRHRRVRRGARVDPPRVHPHRMGARAEPQRWLVVPVGARAARAHRPARRAGRGDHVEPQRSRRLLAGEPVARAPQGQHEPARHRAAGDRACCSSKDRTRR